MSHDILQEICQKKKQTINQYKSQISESKLLDTIKNSPHLIGFKDALENKKNLKKWGLIAEIKKASPSKGLIRENFNPVKIAKEYETAGATCLSILTDEPYFAGKDIYLQNVRQETTLPILRKDFIIDPYQVLHTRYLQADCMLLIMAALDQNQAEEIYSSAQDVGIDVLVEVHNEDELERALLLNPSLIGINNRNLKTLEIDLKTSERLSQMIPSDIITICESGIRSHQNLIHFSKYNIYCFLVGELLMSQQNIKQATMALLGHNL